MSKYILEKGLLSVVRKIGERNLWRQSMQELMIPGVEIDSGYLEEGSVLYKELNMALK